MQILNDRVSIIANNKVNVNRTFSVKLMNAHLSGRMVVMLYFLKILGKFVFNSVVAMAICNSQRRKIYI